MKSPELEDYYRIKHQLDELIDDTDSDEITDEYIDAAREARSQIIALETFTERQFDLIINHITMQGYYIRDMLENVNKHRPVDEPNPLTIDSEG